MEVGVVTSLLIYTFLHEEHLTKEFCFSFYKLLIMYHLNLFTKVDWEVPFSPSPTFWLFLDRLRIWFWNRSLKQLSKTNFKTPSVQGYKGEIWREVYYSAFRQMLFLGEMGSKSCFLFETTLLGKSVLDLLPLSIPFHCCPLSDTWRNVILTRKVSFHITWDILNLGHSVEIKDFVWEPTNSR